MLDKSALKDLGIDIIGHQIKIIKLAERWKQNNNNNNNNMAPKGGGTVYI